MITKILMPKLNMSMISGLVAKWFKKEGDLVSKGDPICVIEGDKASIELEAPTDGTLIKIVVGEGDESPVLKSIAFIGNIGDDYESMLKEEAMATSSEPVATRATQPKNTTITEPATPGGKVRASPVAKRLAAELNIDLTKVKGTGLDGLIGREDVLAAKELHGEAVASPKTTLPKIAQTVKATGIKAIVANRLKASYLDAPHIHLTLSVDASTMNDFRDKWNQQATEQSRLSVTDILIWGVSRVLVNHTLLNSSFQNGNILTYADINIGFAAATDKGLVAPVIKQADQKSIEQISQERKNLVERVKTGKQTPSDLEGGTFTITNLGMLEIDAFDPILSPGHSGILSVGKARLMPMVNEDNSIVAKLMITLTLACDHRVADGIDGARFLADLKAFLEDKNKYK